MHPCGMIILRKPLFTSSESLNAVDLPIINNIYYSGIDRMPWFDYYDDYYNKNLPDEMLSFKKDLSDDKYCYNDFIFLDNLEKINKILYYTNRKVIANEIIAACSDKMKIYFSKLSLHVNYEFLGIDIYCHGYGSIIKQGIYVKPHMFSAYIELLNSNGLFDANYEILQNYTRDYIKLARENNLEPIDGDASKGLENFCLWRVLNE